MQRFRELISVANVMIRARVGNPRFGIGGQIATFMLLGIVGMLVFVMMTANLGQLSMNSTRVANAADSSALLLGSLLATKARRLGEALGKPGAPKEKRCVKTGILANLLAAIFALIVAIIVAAITWCEDGCTAAAYAAMIIYTTLAASAAGALGGAIGGAIAGTGAGDGAMQGAITGAIIGAAVGTGSAVGSAYAGPGGATVATGAEGIGFGSGTAPISAGGTLGGAPLVAGSTIGSTMAVPAAVAEGALSAASSLYTASVQEQIRADAFAAVSKKLSGLPEQDQFRETTVLRGLTQTVDDPTGVVDTEDSDEDGDTTEHVPFFQVWFAQRTKQLASIAPVLRGITQGFLSSLSAFSTMAKSTFTSSDVTTCTTDDCKTVTIPGTLSRVEVEGVDGPVVSLARALEDSGHPLRFWEPGPSQASLQTWDDTDCDTCSAPAGYDEVDLTIDTFKEFVNAVDGTDTDPGLKQESLDHLVTMWQTWIKFFFDPTDESHQDFYGRLERLMNGGGSIEGIRAWKGEIEEARKTLPVCVRFDTCVGFDDSGNCTMTISGIENPPCRGDGTQGIPSTGGSIDGDLEDEFTQVQQILDGFIYSIMSFRSDAYQFFSTMQATYTQLGEQFGGLNPVTYRWTDSRGPHFVMVEVGPFKTAFIKKKKYGDTLMGKLCLVLRDFSDSGANTWVKVTRQDPSRPAGFWQWNPQGGTISKMARASYSYGSTPAIAGTK